MCALLFPCDDQELHRPTQATEPGASGKIRLAGKLLEFRVKDKPPDGSGSNERVTLERFYRPARLHELMAAGGESRLRCLDSR